VNIIGVLLAGGLARRMGGGDKPLRLLAGRPLLEHVIERLRPQVAGLVLNANGDPARFAAYGLPIVADSVPDYAGPLAGVLAGLDWTAENRPDCPPSPRTRRFCRAIWWRGWSRGCAMKAPISPAPLPADSRTR
jgi:hypothetical protein